MATVLARCDCDYDCRIPCPAPPNEGGRITCVHSIRPRIFILLPRDFEERRIQGCVVVTLWDQCNHRRSEHLFNGREVTVYRPSLPRIEDVRQQAGVLAGPVAF